MMPEPWQVPPHHLRVAVPIGCPESVTAQEEQEYTVFGMHHPILGPAPRASTRCDRRAHACARQSRSCVQLAALVGFLIQARDSLGSGAMLSIDETDT
jgi:hypothetical protein